MISVCLSLEKKPSPYFIPIKRRRKSLQTKKLSVEDQANKSTGLKNEHSRRKLHLMENVAFLISGKAQPAPDDAHMRRIMG